MSAWPALGQFDHPLNFALVDLGIGAQPGAHQGLETQLVGNARGVLVAVCA